MPIDLPQLRQIVLDHLRAHPDGQVNLIGGNFVAARAQQLGLAYTIDDGARVLDVFHDLYREGVIASGSHPTSLQPMSWPFYRVTAYGQAVLQTRDYVPQDRDGYLTQIQRDIPDIDPIVIRYLDEALGCFKGGHMLGAAVMTGCAAEKTTLLLIEGFANALCNPQENAKFRSVIDGQWMINRKYTEFWKLLQRKLNVLPRDLSDDLEVILDRVFDLIRSARNDAGHPTGKTVDRDVVRANFILFPTYCKRVFVLVRHLQSSTI